MAINTRPQYTSGTPAAKPRSGRTYTVLGLVLAVLGFGLVILFTSLTGGKTTAPSATATANVVVAARDISVRTPITAADLTVVHYVLGDVPPGAYKTIDQVKGLVAGVQIMKGQPLTSNLLAKSPDAVAAAQPAYLPIPAGWVALTIPTGEQQGVGGYISPGDYITVTASVAGRNGTNVRTLFTNVHVLRVGPAQGSDSSQSAAKTTGITSSLTVVVTQCQAEYLNWFLANAQIKYTLESYQDYKPQDTSADATCPNVSSASGVTKDNVAARWTGIFN